MGYTLVAIVRWLLGYGCGQQELYACVWKIDSQTDIWGTSSVSAQLCRSKECVCVFRSADDNERMWLARCGQMLQLVPGSRAVCGQVLRQACMEAICFKATLKSCQVAMKSIKTIFSANIR